MKLIKVFNVFDRSDVSYFGPFCDDKEASEALVGRGWKYDIGGTWFPSKDNRNKHLRAEVEMFPDVILEAKSLPSFN